MKYTKPSLTVEQQADLLISRGLIADRNTLISILSDISYYRLSGYLYPYRNPTSTSFIPGTNFTEIFDHYLFDRQLRVIVMDAVERVEVSIKTRLVNLLTKKYGPFAQVNRANFPGMQVEDHRKLMEKIHQSTDRSKEVFVRHYLSTYTSATEVPLWIAMEIMDFGAMLTLFRHCEHYDKREIAKAYNVSAKVLDSWLLTLNFVRNTCAHHGRLWNRNIPIKPFIPDYKNCPAFHIPKSISNDRVFAIVSILHYLLKHIAPKSGWGRRVESLITDKHPTIPLKWMGFPGNWKDYRLWE